MSPPVVGVVFVSILAIVSLWDAWLAFDGTDDNTISTVLRTWFVSMAWLYYLSAFALGVLMGHWGPV